MIVVIIVDADGIVDNLNFFSKENELTYIFNLLHQNQLILSIIVLNRKRLQDCLLKQ